MIRFNWLRTHGFPVLSLALLMGTACSGGAVMTSSHIAGTPRSPIVGGVIYYLPKRVIPLEIWSIKVDGVQVATSEELPDPTVRNPRARPAKERTGPPAYFALMGDPQTVPDRNYLMHLVQDHSASYSDKVEIVMTEDGLLTSVSSTVTDEGPKVVAQLAQLARLAAGVPVKPKGADESIEGQTVSWDLVAAVVVDPTDPADVRKLYNSYQITLKATPMISGAEAGCVLTPAGACEPVCRQSGVCYRPVIPYSVTISPSAVLTPPSNRNEVAALDVMPDGIQQIYMLPNRSPVVCLPIERAPFVSSKFRVDFSNGLLTKMSSTKPSEILGFMSIPIDIARAIVSIPGELLQVKVTNYGNVAKAAENEQKALEALESLEQRKRGE